MGMTMAEKIIAAHCGRREVKPGEYVWAKVDGTGVIGLLMRVIGPLLEELKIDRVFDPERVYCTEDHLAPSPNLEAAQDVSALRAFVKKYGITHWFEFGRHGILHQLFPENGYVVPGDLIASVDSHSTSYGCFNAMGVPVMEESPYVIAKGELWLRVPESIRFELVGELPEYIVGKDIILKIAGSHGTDVAIYKSVEFVGPVARALSLGSRFSMANMGVELGAKCALFEADAKTMEFLAGRIRREPQPVIADPDAVYEAVYTVDVTGMEPQVALPHDPGNVRPVSQVSDMHIKIHQAFLGSCTSGRLEDMQVTARILKGRKVHPDVRFIVSPASQEQWRLALQAGYLDVLSEAGCLVCHSTCGPCCGGPLGLLAAGERCISTSNRNFQGRMGSPEAEVYLASPATVAASAVAGEVTDPRDLLASGGG
ncbi:MAG: 3-isopropylmalate dehydratase large subunit [bacterium]